jgi:hypothetical protein
MTRSFKITHDRSYWRATPDKVILEAARDSDDELAIALGERLEACLDKIAPLEDLKEEVEYLSGTVDALRAELYELYGAGE